MDTSFTEELKNLFYSADFLDSYSLEPPPQEVTAIIPTRKRSPYDPRSQKGKLNPLKWCIDALMSQKNSGLKRIMIIDDASGDYTRRVVEQYQKDYPTEVIYMRNEERSGLPITRNRGIENADTEFIYLCDDDCIASPYTIFGGLFTFLRLKEMGKNVGAVNLPVYNRATIPPYIKKANEIGKVDLENGILSFDSHAFPLEFIGNIPEEEKFSDAERRILNPIKVENFNAHLLLSRNALEKIGGFPEDFTWRNSSGEESEVALRLQESGYNQYFNPDIKFHTVHLKYGAPGRDTLIGSDWKEKMKLPGITLEEMIHGSARYIHDTGCRVPPYEWIESDILGHLIVIGRRNIKGALNLAKRAYKRFVVDNDPGIYTTFCSHIENIEVRKRIWKSAIEKSIQYLGCDILKEEPVKVTPEYEDVVACVR